ncbi:MAG: ABC transporter substrate-binding protein [Chitinophagaceae bacterium]
MIKILLISLLFSYCTKQEKEESLVIWANNDDTISFVSHFTNKYPQISVTYINQASEFQNKLQNVIRAKQGEPDLFFAEVQDLKKYIDRGWYTPLEGEYDLSSEQTNMPSYIWDIGYGRDKQFYAVGYQATPVGFFYRKSLARQYLGTDNPEQISQMINTWENIKLLSQKVYQQSGGNTVFFDGLEGIYQAFLVTRSTPWVKDSKLYIDPVMLDFMDYIKDIYTNQYSFVSPNIWDNTWYNRHCENKIIGTFLPTWGLRYNLLNVQKAQSDWGVASVIEPFFWGGGWLGIYSDSKKKDSAYLYLKEFISYQASLNYALVSRDFPANLQAMDTFVNTLEDPNLAQIYYFFTTNVTQINNKQVDLLTQYDGVLRELFMEAIIAYMFDEKTKEQAIEDFRILVVVSFPDLEI